MAVMTRQALFEAAWERPLTDIAEDIGITSTGLKKICDRHDIPTPGRGYWAQVRAGRTFPRPKLRPVEDPRLEAVRITGARPLPPVVAAAMQKVRDDLPSVRKPRGKSKPPAVVETVAAKGEAPSAEAAPVDPTPEAADAARPERRDLAATRKALAKARPDEMGYTRVFGKGVVSAQLGAEAHGAALRFLDLLLEAAEARGWRLEPTDDGAVLRVEGEALAIRIEDRPKQVPHTPTAQERAVQAQRERWGGSGQVWRT